MAGTSTAARAAATPAAASTIGVLSSDESDDEVPEVEPQLFNEKLDDKDEAWAIEQRRGRRSDAILTCPACFSTLCIDCQRHEKYVHQYRAMFVTNCKILENERLRLPAHRQTRKSQRRRKKGAAANVESTSGEAAAPETESEEDVFQPVHCSVCDTNVAVIDKDEVYHFFNIVPSYS